MNIGILVDATCDLPTSIFERYNVNIIPISFSYKNESYDDIRNIDFTNTFYQDWTAKAISNTESLGISSESLVSRLKDDLIYQYDGLLIPTPHNRLSNSLQTFRENVFDLQPKIEMLRRQASLTKPFKIRIIETDQAYAGYGLIVYEALRLMHEKARSTDQLKAPLSLFKNTVITYILPGIEEVNSDLLTKPPFSMGWLETKKLKLSNSFPILEINSHDIIVTKQVPIAQAEQAFYDLIYLKLYGLELESHLINVSYAGKLAQLRIKPAFKELHQQVIKKGGKLVHSVMSQASAIQLGAGAISVSFSTRKR